MDDFEENVFLESEMENFQFPESETDGDKLEAMKDEAKEASEFKKWLHKQTTSTFKNIAGIDSFIDFLAELPVEERKYIESMFKEKAILGNPTIETNLIMRYGLPHATGSWFDGLTLMSDELNGINRTLADESIHNILLLKQELRTFATLIKKAVQVSMAEIEAASARQQAEQQAQYELKVIELEGKVKAAEAEFARYLEAKETKHKQSMEEATMEVRKLALKQMTKTIKEVASEALKESLGSYNVKHGFYTGCFVFGAMALYNLCTKLFS